MSAVKIQINSLEALERLIGGDSALEFEIRNNIVHEFAQKHLKSLVPDVVAHQKGRIEAHTNEFIEKNFFDKQRDGWGYRLELKPAVRDAIKSCYYGAFESAIQDIVAKKVSDVLRLVEGPGYIESLVNRQVDVEIEKKVKQIVAEKVKQLGTF